MPSGAPPKDLAVATLARGATIGRYVVLGLVGRGGMGEVYAAYDPELDRKVAVKLLRIKRGAGVSLTEGRQRTLREAQAIARLSHPNVVVVFDVGTYQDQVFIAMEFVEGNTATYWLQAADRSWQEILKVFLAAGRGLAAAHEKGLVHRDFKPDNVMVGRDNQVRVMDFGLARQVTEKSAVTAADRVADKPVTPSEGGTTPTQRIPAAVADNGAAIDFDSASTIVISGLPGGPVLAPTETQTASSGMFEVQLTRTGAMMGTPAYMAPEQFLGAPTDARTDQFSFCVALYEALYGQRPFGGNTMFALTSNVVQGKVRDPPGESNVPPWIRRILMRGLRPTVNERFASMNELLEAFAKDPAVKRRKVVAAGLAASLAVVLVVGGRQVLPDRSAVCGGGPAKLAGVWEVARPGQPSALARRTRIKNAFLHTGKGYAANVYSTVDRALNTYAESWAAMHQEACEATQVRGEQSAEVLDLRMSCLQERLGGMRALTDLFAEASGDVVENAVSAVNALGSLDRCADVPLLRSVVRPPEDPSTRARVAELRRRLAGLKARYDAGRWKEVVQQMPARWWPRRASSATCRWWRRRWRSRESRC